MRKAFLISSLVAATLALAVHDVSAQRVRIGVGGGRGVTIGTGSGYYGSPNYYGRGYNNYYYRPGYTYSNPGFYSAPSYYYYTEPAVDLPAPEVRQSYYADPTAATLIVLVPDAAAQVWFDDNLTTQRGMERTFHTPGLQFAGTYTIKVRWTQGGRTMDQERRVQVQPGQSVTVDFRGEQIPIPRPPQP